MNIPKEIINKALEGRWKPLKTVVIYASDAFEQYDSETIAFYNGSDPETAGIIGRINTNRIVLDPLFWQALGKALGWGKKPYHTKTGEEWGERFCNHCGISTDIQPSRESGCNHVHYPEDCNVCSRNIKSPNEVAHDFYDLILTGGDMEKFWNDLLPSNK